MDLMIKFPKALENTIIKDKDNNVIKYPYINHRGEFFITITNKEYKKVYPGSKIFIVNKKIIDIFGVIKDIQKIKQKTIYTFDNIYHFEDRERFPVHRSFGSYVNIETYFGSAWTEYISEQYLEKNSRVSI